MFLFYSILLALGFLVMLPWFLLRSEKYASGFRQRLGSYPEFDHDDRPVIWLHCVSVGEVNAARPLVDELPENFPDSRLVISTTTRSGQDLARRIFSEKAAATFYFPFDWKFSVHRALSTYKPSVVLLMETEIWPRFIRESKRAGAKIAIINGRLSQTSFKRYSWFRRFVARVLAGVDLALMQGDGDADRIQQLGMEPAKIAVTGNLKFEQRADEAERSLTAEFRVRFGVSAEQPLIVAASTHEPEERYVVESLHGELGHSCRLMIAPRHPERFDSVEELLRGSSYRFVRRTAPPSGNDRSADVILLDTIGELRAVYPLAEVVFVGGSLIPHGGQNIIEPAAAGKAIVTGPFTQNFDAVVEEFLENEAIRQMPEAVENSQIARGLREAFLDLLRHPEKRAKLGAAAAAVMRRSGRDATRKTIEALRPLVSELDETER